MVAVPFGGRSLDGALDATRKCTAKPKSSDGVRRAVLDGFDKLRAFDSR